jgi:hypothetical protein
MKLSPTQRAAMKRAADSAGDLVVGHINTLRNLHAKGLVQQPRAMDAVHTTDMAATLTLAGRQYLEEMKR